MFDVVVVCFVLVATSGRHKVISWRYQISAELTLILWRTEISNKVPQYFPSSRAYSNFVTNGLHF